MKIKKRQTGFGLLELMLSMVIVALLLIMATRYYQSARSNARINQGVSLVASIVNAANNMAIGTGNYKTVNATAVVPYLPSNAQGSDQKSIVDPWGGAVTVAPSTDSGTAGNAFVITMNGLGADCQKLADALGTGKKTGSTISYDSSTCGTGILTITQSLSATPATPS